MELVERLQTLQEGREQERVALRSRLRYKLLSRRINCEAAKKLDMTVNIGKGILGELDSVFKILEEEGVL